jgi:hypothetical protein
MHSPAMTISNVWLVDILPNGSGAFREGGAVSIAKDARSRELARLALFAKGDYGASRLAELRQTLKRALVGAGLYEAEAEAMLETWKDSYFGTPGLRLFYLVPNEWTQYFLPLTIAAPNQLTRVLVGRIDLERGAVN